MGRRTGLLSRRLPGRGVSASALAGLPPRRGADGRAGGSGDSSGSRTTSDEHRHHPRDRWRGRLHRQRPASDGRPGSSPSAGPGDRLRPDAGGAGPLMAPGLSPMESRFLPPATSHRRRARAALALARHGGRRGCLPDRPILDPVRAALPVAAAATRGGHVDRRRLRGDPARLRGDIAARGGGRHDSLRMGSRSSRHASSPSRCSGLA